MHKVKQHKGVAVAAAVCAVAMAASLATQRRRGRGPALLTGWRYRVIGGIN